MTYRVLFLASKYVSKQVRVVPSINTPTRVNPSVFCSLKKNPGDIKELRAYSSWLQQPEIDVLPASTVTPPSKIPTPFHDPLPFSSTKKTTLPHRDFQPSVDAKLPSSLRRRPTRLPSFHRRKLADETSYHLSTKTTPRRDFHPSVASHRASSCNNHAHSPPQLHTQLHVPPTI
jgi:hypothetical protein